MQKMAKPQIADRITKGADLTKDDWFSFWVASVQAQTWDEVESLTRTLLWPSVQVEPARSGGNIMPEPNGPNATATPQSAFADAKFINFIGASTQQSFPGADGLPALCSFTAYLCW